MTDQCPTPAKVDQSTSLIQFAKLTRTASNVREKRMVICASQKWSNTSSELPNPMKSSVETTKALADGTCACVTRCLPNVSKPT